MIIVIKKADMRLILMIAIIVAVGHLSDMLCNKNLVSGK